MKHYRKEEPKLPLAGLVNSNRLTGKGETQLK
jgi:hypothetical protein